MAIKRATKKKAVTKRAKPRKTRSGVSTKTQRGKFVSTANRIKHRAGAGAPAVTLNGKTITYPKVEQPKKKKKDDEPKEETLFLKGQSNRIKTQVLEAKYRGEDKMINIVDTSTVDLSALNKDQLFNAISAITANTSKKRINALRKLVADETQSDSVREMAKALIEEYEGVADVNVPRGKERDDYSIQDVREWLQKLMKFSFDEPATVRELKTNEKRRSQEWDVGKKYGGLIDATNPIEKKMWGDFMDTLRASSMYALYYSTTDSDDATSKDFVNLWNIFRANYAEVNGTTFDDENAIPAIREAYKQFRRESVEAYGAGINRKRNTRRNTRGLK